MELFFTQNIDNSKAYFSDEEARHIARVFRKREGDPIYFTNGQGKKFTGTITAQNRHSIEVDITAAEEKTKTWTGSLTVAMAATKNFNRIEWVVERMIEMGIDDIVLLETDHAERTSWKLDRLERIAISALKQSQQYQLPRIHAPVRFTDWLDHLAEGVQFYIGHCYSGEKIHLRDIHCHEKSVGFCVGPEGDFSKEEVQKATECGMTPISLGETRLRTETAAFKMSTHFSVQNDI